MELQSFWSMTFSYWIWFVDWMAFIRKIAFRFNY